MIRLIIFLLGFGMFLYGAASNFESIPLPFDPKSIAIGISTTALTLDVVLVVAGVFLVLVAWVTHRLTP
jgi:hypothetical protein